MIQSMKGQLEDAAEKRATLVAELKAIMDNGAKTQTLSEEEADRCRAIGEEIKEIDRFTDQANTPPPDYMFDDDHSGLWNADGSYAGQFFYPARMTSGKRRSIGPVFQDADGNRIQAYSGRTAISGNRGVKSGDLGNAIHSILRGQPLNVNVGSTDSAGGYIINPEFGTRFIDLARSASVTMRAGAITIPMSSGEHIIAGLAADPTSHWRAETVAVPSTDVTFNKITLRAKTLACIVPVSIEMLEDASNAGQIIEGAIQASMGQKLDAAGLMGTGAESEPKGIRNHADVNTIASVGTPADYIKFSLGIGDVMAANYPGMVEDLAWINHPRTDDTLDGLQDTTNQPLMMTPRVAKLQRFSTTALPTDEGSSESVSIIGDFTQLAFGMRTQNIVVRILDAGTVTDSAGDTWNATSQLMRHIVVYLRADVAVLRPSWFTVLTGITA